MEDFKMALDTEKIIADLKEASILELNDLVKAIEDEFGVEIDDTKAEAISTVGDLVSYIEELKK